MATCLAQNGARVCECLPTIIRKLNVRQTLPVVALKNYKRQHLRTQTGFSQLLLTRQKRKTSNVRIQRQDKFLLICRQLLSNTSVKERITSICLSTTVVYQL